MADGQLLLSEVQNVIATCVRILGPGKNGPWPYCERTEYEQYVRVKEESTFIDYMRLIHRGFAHPHSTLILTQTISSAIPCYSIRHTHYYYAHKNSTSFSRDLLVMSSSLSLLRSRKSPSVPLMPVWCSLRMMRLPLLMPQVLDFWLAMKTWRRS